VLEVHDGSFVIDGEPTFLLGISYYGGLGASDEVLGSDLDRIAACGFNWLRVWATWTAFGEDVSAVNDDGSPREPYVSRLVRLVNMADARGMVVDVTLTRGLKRSDGESRLWGKLPDFAAHERAVETITETLRDRRNVYIDLANERNVGDDRFVPISELAALRKMVRSIDPDRLVTASHGGDMIAEDARAYIDEVGVDLLTPHRDRYAGSPGDTPARTREYLSWITDVGQDVALHYQEPFRRGYDPGRWNPVAADFVQDLDAAFDAGAAGWCFHNGDTRMPGSDGRPRRSFDLREGSLFDGLDREERAFVESLSEWVRRHGRRAAGRTE